MKIVLRDKTTNQTCPYCASTNIEGVIDDELMLELKCLDCGATRERTPVKPLNEQARAVADPMNLLGE